MYRHMRAHGRITDSTSKTMAFPVHVFFMVYCYIQSYMNLFFKIGVYDNCEADSWSWTAKGILAYKNKWCIRPVAGWINPGNNFGLMLDSACDHAQNFFQFIPSKYCSVFYTIVKIRDKYISEILSRPVQWFCKGTM